MIFRATTALFLSLAAFPLNAQEKPISPEKKGEAWKDAEGLPEELQEFLGEITGKVVSVDATAVTLRVKVESGKPDAAKNKATKPELIAGRTITITPLLKKGADGKQALDADAVDFIKNVKEGDTVTLPVRASSRGVLFRLLKAPAGGVKP